MKKKFHKKEKFQSMFFFKKVYLLLFFLMISSLWQTNAQGQIGSDINGESLGDNSGESVSISADGTVVAIGAPQNDDNGSGSGHVRIFENIAGTWTQIGDDIDGENLFDESGSAISLSGDGTIVAIGALRNDGNGSNSGHVRIFENLAGTWTQIGADIDGNAAGDESGTSVSLSNDGSIVAIGAPRSNGNGNVSGQVRIFQNIAGTWTQIGADINGENSVDRSGTSVDLSSDGSIVAIGADGNDGNGNNSGHVRIFENIAGTWTQIGADIDGETTLDQSGRTVSLSADGTIVAIGAPFNDGTGDSAGHVRVFENISGTWTQVGTDIDGNNLLDNSGISISLSADGSTLAIGADGNDGNGDNSGHVRIFENIAGTWTQVLADITGEAEGDRSGVSVSLSADGSIVSIGASQNDENGSNSGHVRIFSFSLLSIDDIDFSRLTLSPNPAFGVVILRNEQGLELSDISIFDIRGRLLQKINLTTIETETTIDVSNLDNAIYIAVISSQRNTITKRLIVNN